MAVGTSEKRAVGGAVVERYRILSTNVDVYNAWEAYAGHSTVRYADRYAPTIPGKSGRIGTRQLPDSIAVLPAMSQERSEAVRAFYEAQEQEAYALILQAFPEAADGRFSMGEVTRVEEGS